MSKEYIDREEVILAVRHAWAKGLEPTQYIEQIPAADVIEKKHGYWIKRIEDYPIRNVDYICSRCEDCGSTGVLCMIWRIGVFHCPSCGCYKIGTVQCVDEVEMDKEE